jgi:hypothetical protein
MAKTKKEEVVEQPEVKQEEVVKDKPLKVKKRPKKLVTKDEEPTKVDLTKVKEEVKEETPEKPVEETKEKVVEEIKEEVTPEEKTEVEDTPVLEEITDEEEKVEEQPTKEEVVEAVKEAETTGRELPENIQKVMDFMNDTGGNLEDYVKLNQDYGSYDENRLLREYYKQTKPHLNDDEISFLMEDQFSVDEDVDEERDVRRKKLALKEQVAAAKNHLDGLKSRYYEEIKSGAKLAPEQQQAIEFFNRYKQESEVTEKQEKDQRDTFLSKTDNFFNKEFKGFEYEVGDKKFRFNVKDVDKTKTDQSDINNFTAKFLDKQSKLMDPKGYHKSLFTAMNPDVVAQHFYEQGKADAIKDSVAKSKNVSMEPRKTHPNAMASGLKVRAIPGDTSSDFKIKIRK